MTQGESSRPTGQVLESEKPSAAPAGSAEQTRDVEAGVAPPTQAAQPPLPQPYHPQQQQLPYAPYPQQPFPYAQPVRVLPPYSKTWTISKLVLTGLSLCWGIVILALSLVLSVAEGYGLATIIALYGVPVQIVAIIWNLAELTTFWVRAHKAKETRRGIHPGAHIGMHLLFWLASAFGIFMALSFLYAARYNIQDCLEEAEHDDDDSSYINGSYYSDYCDYYSTPNLLLNTRALLAMWCLAIITHFSLFVLACIDTSQRNRLKPAGIVFAAPPSGAVPQYVAAPPPGAYPVAYYPAPPQHAYMTGAAAAAPQGKAPVPQPQQQQNYQNLAGFYAPPPVPAQAPTPTPAPAPASAPQPAAQS